MENFSNSTLLRLLRKPEGGFLFKFENRNGKTPVQCRASYKNVRSVDVVSRGSSDCLCEVKIGWRDDTLVVKSSNKDRHEHDVIRLILYSSEY